MFGAGLQEVKHQPEGNPGQEKTELQRRGVMKQILVEQK